MNNILIKAALLTFLSFSNGAYASDFDDGARYAFSLSREAGSVEIIDLEEDVKAGSIKFERQVQQVKASKGLNVLIVSHPQDEALTLVDLTSEALEQYVYPLKLRPDFITLSPLDYNLAIYDQSRQILQVQSLHRKQTLAHIEGISSGELITFSFEGSQVYVVERDRGELIVIDLLENSISQRIKLAREGDAISALSRTIDGNYGFISNASKNVVYVIDLIAYKKIAEVRVGKKPGRPWGTADGSKIMVPNYDDDSISIISAITFETLSTVRGVNKPLAINTGWVDTTAAVIGEAGEFAFIDLLKGKVVKKIHLGGVLDEGVVTSDSRTLAVSVGELGHIAIFDMRKRKLKKVLEGLPTDVRGIGMAISNNYCH